MLLAVLLTAAVAARRHVAHQSYAAAQKRRAVAAADSLLAVWWQNPRALPRPAGGAVLGVPDLAWRTAVVDDPVAAALKTQIVRLQITTATDPTPLTSVDLILDVENPTTRPAAKRLHRR